ncbi:MAG: 2-amino-4-hydroxy-6-hydroxymethyldihydropteridine diphosphokinase [Candidatus Omnitrophota bacterium]|jgi:2-amino-4-hydroxy-6-hydroxymethyldihydropteridine diphosphokinase
MALIYLGLGSNIGDRLKHITEAIRLLSNHIVVDRVSAIIETDPIGGPPQEKYLNAVLKAETSLSAHELLEKTQAIEHVLGRVRTGIQNAPRIIDIDILLYDQQHINDQDLTIPHPRMTTRAFVMKPLEEIDPRLAHSLSGESR